MNLPGYILALDQGTTSSRAIVFNHQSEIVSIAQKEFAQIYPQPGWVEHKPIEIWSSQASVAAAAVLNAGLQPSQIAAIGITNQRETTIVWDRETGDPVYNAIVWQDRRTAPYCQQLREQGHSALIREKTGLVIDAYFSASKIKWILDHVEGAREKAQQGRLLFGTVDSWLVWNLTGGKVHVTDATNAARTMIFNIHTLDWDADLLSLFDIPASMLPPVKSCSEVYGETAGQILSAKIPIAGMAGDQHAALFGQMGIREGLVKNTYGTGCFMLMNTGAKPVPSHNNLLTTLAWRLGDKTTYALEGSIFIGGAVVQWLRDGLGLISSASEVEALAAQVSDSGGVCLVPAFAGLGAPYWNGAARGTLVGITRGTTASHIAWAALESIALQTLDVLKAMEADCGTGISELRVDGGASVNNLLMQIQADILGTRVVRPQITETTALGAAYFAGLAVQYWNSIEDVQEQWKADRIFTPSSPNRPDAQIKQWNRAVKACIAWTEE